MRIIFAFGIVLVLLSLGMGIGYHSANRFLPDDQKLSMVEYLQGLAGMDSAVQAIPTAQAEPPDATEGEGVFSGLINSAKGVIFGEKTQSDPTAPSESRQDALVAAAQSGDAATAAALAAVEFNAIAAELEKGAAMPATPAAPAPAGVKVGLGVGACAKRGGGKFCSVDGSN